MYRIKKLIGILFILGIVFFIICDEKGIKIELQDGKLVFNEIEKPKEIVIDPNAVYKNSDLVHINYEFENPRTLRKGDGMDPEYLARLKQEKKLEKERLKNQEKVYTGPNLIALDKEDSISSVFKGTETQNTGAAKPEVKQNTGTAKPEVKQNTGTAKSEVKQNTGTAKPEVKQNTGTTKPEVKQNTGIAKPEMKQNTGTAKPEVKQNTGTAKPEVKQNTGTAKPEVKQNTGTTKSEETKEVVYYPVKKYEHEKISLNLSNGVEKPTYKVEKYQGKENLVLNLYEGKNLEPTILYKNSNRIKLYSGFENPRNMRNSAGIDENFLVKQENNKPAVISLNDDTISSAWQNEENEDENSISIGTEIENNTGNILDLGEDEEVEEVKYEVEKYEHEYRSINMSKGKIIEQELITIDKPELSNHSINISEGKQPEIVLVKIDKYQGNVHTLNLKKGKVIKHDFVVENSEELQQTENGLSDPMLESLLENEEIDIETLESENDEFLQKVFEKTRDKDVLNLIIETYLNEYQFVKAKRFIENLPDMYRDELKPSLNLRVAFNSFSLSSKTINENLKSLLREYSEKNVILDEDKNRYLGVIALMDRNYDRFFEISNGFTSEKYKAFSSKLQGYKDQISKQMGMPDYYFDTLVSLELFNQGFFQPAKVIALYSLQQNINYILPYQVLAYANFLTNSWDTSIEYFKKLVDLDPNNAEKYRFLMGVASYRDEKYEQSVVMLSMIKDEELRLDTQRYLINDYLKLDQKNKLISSRNKLLGYENLVASDFYTYFYETFFRPYSQGEDFQLYALDIELANKMLRVCSIALQDEEKAVCTYGTIGRNLAMGQFDGLEHYLLDLVAEYPQGYLYHALGEYYIKQGELDKAKAYLLKAVSLTQKKSELSQIKKLLQETM